MKVWLISILLMATMTYGQFVTITGTVVDPNSCAYANGSGRVVLVPQNQQFLVNGTNPVQSPIPISGLDAFGKFSIQLTNTSLIAPASANPQWQFSFCSQGFNGQQPACFTMSPMSLTTSQDISSQIQSQAAPIPNCNGSSLELQTNGVDNGSQDLLNLQQGTGMTLTDDGSGTVTVAANFNGSWSSLTDPAGSLNLSMGTNTSIFNYNGAVAPAFAWLNLQGATVTVPTFSPVLDLQGNYWNGSASAADAWYIQSIIGVGTNGSSSLTFAHSGTSGAAALVMPSVILQNVASGTQCLSAASTGAVSGTGAPCSSPKLRCETGLGDGLNAIVTGTYLQYFCVNDSGATWTITGIHCWTDNAGSSTLNAANNAGTGLLTGAVTCNNTKAGGGAAGSQSATTTLANGDAVNFTFVADGTSKQTTWVVSLTQ